MTLYYLATPYSNYPGGIEAAYREACNIAERLRWRGDHVFCPVEVFHPLAAQTGVDKFDHEFWMECCDPWIKRCDVLIIAKIDGWEQSAGITHEREMFSNLGKPVRYFDPRKLFGRYVSAA